MNINLENKYIVLFETTTHALSFESIAKKHNIPGRLIPVPGSIKSGCGMC